jgi:hypothetical protein
MRPRRPGATMELTKEAVMTTRAVHHDHGDLWHDGHRLAMGSLLAIAVFVVWMMLLAPVGWALQGALDLDDGQLLYEAGGWGWLAYAGMVLATAIPPAVGIVLALRALALGERRLGTVGVAANALVAMLFVVAPLVAGLVG